MSGEARKSGWPQLLLVAAAFFGPLIGAAWLYYQGDSLQPETRANHGALLEPITNLHDLVPESAILEHRSWLLLYGDDGQCSEGCRKALYTIRQARLMLGREMDRVERVFLHGAEPPDTLFIAEEYKGLITLQDAALRSALDKKKPGSLPDGGYFLIDPHGNLVLYFRPDINPRDMVDDIKRLLKLSRIG